MLKGLYLLCWNLKGGGTIRLPVHLSYAVLDMAASTCHMDICSVPGFPPELRRRLGREREAEDHLDVADRSERSVRKPG